MGRVTCKPQASSRVIEKPTSSTTGRKKKTACQPRFRGSGKVAKTTMKAKRHFQESLREETSPRVPIPLIKSKKT
ncbi:hypothetical protein GH733_019618 [Mirounga leonina]|nr:hypothetical protein GH733_019618 [Mirounga leonina]